MSFEMQGTLYKKFETEMKSSSFQAREFVVTTEENYPQYVKFQLVQDKCSLLDQYQEGQKIKVSFDLKGREWQGKFFTNLGAWRIDGVDASKPIADSKEPQGFDSFEPIENPFNSGPEDFQDLPF
ncbi:MAG: DUF3127 domain-containing protein [Saprospiraceae bacterium]|nr:DUF3127 domain-containing protein [Saprospiraceae bacterium]MBK8632314.1 DUF3127 domain-containing protein [Saprospiraceae bacterium]MBP7643796.1 DUF3127 domain-containing protein [Saprospiraceae bacterium]HOY14617.1 DUF3127 domain-containing protein [Saprospiraceae bacterium]HPN70972.1 DUF3127 domain-containing protein [Saprospiraceae bacterium]